MLLICICFSLSLSFFLAGIHHFTLLQNKQSCTFWLTTYRTQSNFYWSYQISDHRQKFFLMGGWKDIHPPFPIPWGYICGQKSYPFFYTPVNALPLRSLCDPSIALTVRSMLFLQVCRLFARNGCKRLVYPFPGQCPTHHAGYLFIPSLCERGPPD